MGQYRNINQYHAILGLAYPVFEKVENSNVLKQQGYDGLASHGCWPSGPPTERRARQRASGRFWAEVQGDPGSSWVNPGETCNDKPRAPSSHVLEEPR